MANKKGLAVLELEVYGTGSQPPATGSGGSSKSSGGGGGFRMQYVFFIISGLTLLAMAAFALAMIRNQRRAARQRQAAAAMELHSTANPPHNAVAAAPFNPLPPLLPAGPAPVIGTPVHGTPVTPYYGTAAPGTVPTYVATVGAGGQAGIPEWMRKQMEPQQGQPQQHLQPYPQCYAGASSSAAPPPPIGAPATGFPFTATAPEPAAAAGPSAISRPAGTPLGAVLESTDGGAVPSASTPSAAQCDPTADPTITAAAGAVAAGATLAAAGPAVGAATAPPPQPGWLAAVQQQTQQQAPAGVPAPLAGLPPQDPLPGWARQ